MVWGINGLACTGIPHHWLAELGEVLLRSVEDKMRIENFKCCSAQKYSRLVFSRECANEFSFIRVLAVSLKTMFKGIPYVSTFYQLF